MPTVTQVPYEFLVRWREGVFSGAHVGWSLLVTEDDGTKRELPQPVEPVDVGQGKGFPLADILDKLQVDALIAVAAKDDEIAAKVAQHAAAVADKEAALSAKAAELAAELAARQAKEKEAVQLAAELALIKLPEKERKAAQLRAEAAEKLKQAEELGV